MFHFNVTLTSSFYAQVIFSIIKVDTDRNRFAKLALFGIYTTFIPITILGFVHITIGIVWIMNKNYDKYGSWCLIIGLLVLPIVIFAILGTYKCHVVLLFVAMIFLFLTLSVESWQRRNSFDKLLRIHTKDRFKQTHVLWVYIVSSNGNKTALNRVTEWQTTLECCGHTSRNDPEVWQKNITINSTIKLLMSSCCNTTVVQCTPENAYKENCTTKIIIEAKYYCGIMFGILFVLHLLLIPQLIAVMYLIEYCSVHL